MEQQIIVIDIFNQRYLQYFDPYSRDDCTFTDELTQCSFFQESDIPKILEILSRTKDEIWIEFKTVYVKQ